MRLKKKKVSPLTLARRRVKALTYSLDVARKHIGELEESERRESAKHHIQLREARRRTMPMLTGGITGGADKEINFLPLAVVGLESSTEVRDAFSERGITVPMIGKQTIILHVLADQEDPPVITATNKRVAG